MTEKTFPIGSIVKTENKKFVVTGFILDEVKHKFVKSYVVIPYPIGFTGPESLRLVPAAQFELVSEGYHPQTADPYLHFLDNMDFASEYASSEDLNKYLNQAINKMKGGNAK